MEQTPAAMCDSTPSLIMQVSVVRELEVTARSLDAVVGITTPSSPTRADAGRPNDTTWDACAITVVTDTSAALSQSVFPDWLNVMLHSPTLRTVSCKEVAVHTSGVVDVADTSKPEVAVALRICTGLVKVKPVGETAVMVWLAFATVMVIVELAARKFALPAWVRERLQVPARRIVTELLEIVHTAVVRLLRTTVSPELAVAAMVKTPSPNVLLVGPT
jgi:hypothetical protein